jgi:hypothetical protein
MKQHNISRADFKSLSYLSLSDPRTSVTRHPSTPAGLFVYRKHGVDHRLADLIGGLAGLGSQVEQ